MPDVIIIKTRTFGTRIYWPLLYIETRAGYVHVRLKGTAQFGLFLLEIKEKKIIVR